jgi:hypothetical protein
MYLQSAHPHKDQLFGTALLLAKPIKALLLHLEQPLFWENMLQLHVELNSLPPNKRSDHSALFFNKT